MQIYQNQWITIQTHAHELPWLKIFTQKPYKELSQCDCTTKQEIFEKLDFLEKQMIQYFAPEKINIASFGNYLPHVHFHIQARFKNDAYFPEPLWGKKQRESSLSLDLETFYTHLTKTMNSSRITLL